MTIEVVCACGHVADAADDLAGGVMNCPGCGKAVEVPGLRDPCWRALQGLAALVWAGATALAYVSGGIAAAIVTCVAVAALFWLVSRAL